MMHDFCTISLSDRLTPWEVIEQRLQAAAAGDFVVALYNPRSKGRDWQLKRAQEILLNGRPSTTPVVMARQLGRAEEARRHLAELGDINVYLPDPLADSVRRRAAGGGAQALLAGAAMGAGDAEQAFESQSAMHLLRKWNDHQNASSPSAFPDVCYHLAGGLWCGCGHTRLGLTTFPVGVYRHYRACSCTTNVHADAIA